MTKTHLAAFAMLAHGIAVGQLHDAQYPLRFINNATVNISPAIERLKDQQTEHRHQGAQSNSTPEALSAWKLVVGSKISEGAYGWVVKFGNERILLKNPPATEFAEFQRLKSEYLAAKKRLDEIAEEDHRLAQDNSSSVKEAVNLENGYYRNDTARRQAVVRHDELRSERHQISRQQDANIEESNALQSTIARLERIGYRLDGEFPVSCYAINTGFVYSGLPIYDRGVLVK